MEYGAEGSMGRKGAWGGREYGALGTPPHTILHLHPQATTFLSPPGGIYLIGQPEPVVGRFVLQAVHSKTRLDTTPEMQSDS